ncbi:MAG: bacteriohemerythrin [Spirochaetaceae bacterium]|jgi:hemerythrin|nr:bacteriohemerythrin [Spirochaetaceae bacterium]
MVFKKETDNHVTWSNTYSVGIKVIDNQHKGLLDLVNDLFNHATGNEIEERAYFTEVIQHVVQYVKEHFSTEEKIMIAAQFPGYAEHKKAHDAFVLEVIKSAKEFEAGKRLVLAKLAHFLKDWILAHIGVMDTQYAEYFRKIATRKADGTLSVTKADIKQ